MPAELGRCARSIASALQRAGHEAWLVGGAVRDLAMERTPKDVDLATSATPDDVERLFRGAKGVGRAFGTMLVTGEGVVAQVTTFRSESGYTDARRPDRVEFGRSPQEDARRRDFTCNALYLEPLSDRLLDPENGQDDIRARRLRCVGMAVERFREDGLRLLRMARFAADLDFEVEEHTLAAARSSVGSIAGVSGERVLGELATIFERRGSARALRILADVGVLPRVLPGLDPGTLEARAKLLERCGEPAGAVVGFAALLAPEFGGAEAVEAGWEGALARLRPSNELRRALEDARDAHRRLQAGLGKRSERIRLARSAVWEPAWRLARAEAGLAGASTAALDEFAAFARSATESELRPAPWITSEDLERSGIPRGPRWRELLREAEALQLDGEWASHADALAWLAGQSKL
jgi:tRNA nucleotidyltransferase/poly(A) polymerase